jgi:hypothetical protein
VIRKLIVGNGRTEREVLVVGNLLVGRDPSCHISEPDPLLSRRHAEILSGTHGVSVRDLDSRNGVLVNGEKTREQVLFPGDVVQMGHLLIRYVEEPSDAEPVERRKDRRLPPPDHGPEPTPFDRFKPEQGEPGRWTPEPTPLPGRRSSAPAGASPRVKSITPVPRGRAAYDEATGTGRASDAPDVSDAGEPRDSGLERVYREHHVGDSEATLLAPPGGLHAERERFEPHPDRRVSRNAEPPYEPNRTPTDSTFADAVAHLASIATPAPDGVQPGVGAQLIVNADLRIVDATPECSVLLGVPNESLVGDSLADVFLRGVRRAYTEQDATLSFQIARSSGGSIAVTLSLTRNAGSR